ncbi:ABC transporter substrate-binding protein [Compostimonas suwonensis]|uniref:Multiple sugar transport system substrate-binding protein n=1 Tax=Compostimonas suwonensis TaxID=1048394 RepID=A0A2M9BTU6_9MICO|nr:extracellular solute-binding protein [Compostimonas suwonensis]PJJ61367.1 multiple sugar transport system substrate-binding protein [Compostimonas suwonensis]
MKRRKAPLVVLAAIAVLTTFTGCGASDSSGSGGGDDNELVVWTLEEQADRLAIAQAAADQFTESTGIAVELVGVNEDQFPQLITAAAAAGTLPDVVGALPLSAVRTMSSNELVNTEATATVLSDLDPATFSPAALTLTQEDGAQLAIPSDGFPLSVIYRKDLFEKAGLPAPETYDDVMKAAETLNSPEIAGFVAGNSPSTSYTQQIFEFFALANGCELVDDSGAVTIDSPECVEAFTQYGTLTGDLSVSGAMDSTGTKTTYMAGKAAITMWASFILDEMAGLVDDAMPTCPECADNPRFIAENSGFVTSLSGPDGGPVSGGDVTSWVITADANTEAATQFVEYFMDDAYLQWLSQAPEGKFPTRSGTADEPQKFTDGWKELESGVDTRAKLTDIYSPEVIDALQSGVDNFSRWGFDQGQGNLLGAILTELPIPKAIGALASGEIDGAGAAEQAQQAIQGIQDSIE